MNMKVKKLVILFMFTYMVSYITRINFGAIVSEMESATGIAKELLSLALTGSFLAYGIGQIVSGFFGDIFSPKKLITCGFTATVVMNLLIPLCASPYAMLVVWCANGFAQSFMWPPLVRLMAEFLSEEEYKQAMVAVSLGSSIGTIAVFLVSPILISFVGWKGVFLFSAACGAVMLLFWIKYAPEIKTKKQKASGGDAGASGEMFTPLMLGIMLALVLEGVLRDGVTTWMPTYIAETYNLGNAISILTGVVLPIFSILCYRIAQQLYKKTFTNPMICAGAIFGFGALSSFLLLVFTGKNTACSVLFSAMLTGGMHGVNLILIGMVPFFFKKSNNVSTASGVLNCCPYIGSAVSTYGIAVVSENYGWQYTILLWLCAAALGTALCFACAGAWKKKNM